jgi:hypothetical protein
MSAIFITWQDPDDRRWYPVGKLERQGTDYVFVYTKGAQQSRLFKPFGSLTDLRSRYRSRELFPLFANRLMKSGRREFDDWMRWLDFEGKSPDAIELLARSGGERLTDSLQLYPCPVKTRDGNYETSFFCHGLRYMHSRAIEDVSKLQPGDQLYPMADFFNRADSNAVALRTESPVMMIGFCPRYLAEDVKKLATEAKATFALTVQRVNADAPVQFRVLCRITSAWPENFHPCSSQFFQPIAE